MVTLETNKERIIHCDETGYRLLSFSFAANKENKDSRPPCHTEQGITAFLSVPITTTHLRMRRKLVDLPPNVLRKFEFFFRYAECF